MTFRDGSSWARSGRHQERRGLSASLELAAATLARAAASQCSRAYAVWNRWGLASRSRRIAARPARKASSGTWAYSRRTAATYSA